MPARTSKSLFISFVFISTFWLSLRANAAQNEPKPLNPADPRLSNVFRPKAGDKSLSYKLRLDETGTILGISIYREGESKPVQVLPSCTFHPDRVTDLWTDFQLATLVTFQDFNFDGSFDLQLAQSYSIYLNNMSYCIFLWDSQTGRFRYSPELSVIATGTVIGENPKSRTLHTYKELPEGRWEDSTYGWNEGKVQLIQQSGLYGDWFGTEAEKGPYCRAVYFSCRRRIKGKLVVTLKKWICSPSDETPSPPDCPDYRPYR
ncbi:XAC2610-related protein [Edaphobacter aggregans]|uniref:XAC2610-related protein n=1 Tax=Edaphobacter aggregans TaxID=570835 RepID=UPI000557B666|nr:hypothetical protein [Edaphobacter aggregans]